VAEAKELNIDRKLGSVEGWSYGYSERIGGCVASATFSDQTTVWLGVAEKDRYFFALTNPNWQSIEEGKVYDLQFSALRAGQWRGKFFGLAREADKGVYSVGLKESFLVDVVRTSGIAVNIGSRPIARLSLQGAPSAMQAAIACEREATNKAQPPKKGGGSGTGFLITTEGHILTNEHVVGGCSSVKVQRPGDVAHNARVLAIDAQNDLGLVLADIKSSAVAPLRSDVKLGENVSVFGFPLAQLLASSGNFTVGHVSALAGLKDDTSQFQISAQIHPGNSGGPVLDRNGNVVGVVVATLNTMAVAERTGIVAQNVNFAIKGRTALSFLDANSVKPSASVSSAQLESAELADRAKSFTVKILCEAK
jgi:S1-C subfamily serine protease